MAGNGPAPKLASQRRTRHRPRRGEWRSAPVGWRYGPVPDPPDGLSADALETWRTWFSAWFAGHWHPGDVPGLRTCIQIYDAGRMRELLPWLHNYGMRAKGERDRRWLRPDAKYLSPEPARVSDEPQTYFDNDDPPRRSPHMKRLVFGDRFGTARDKEHAR